MQYKNYTLLCIGYRRCMTLSCHACGDRLQTDMRSVEASRVANLTVDIVPVCVCTSYTVRT